MPAHAAEDGWSFEITPYIWAVGLDADVTIRGRTAKVDKSFDELFDAVDIGGALLLRGQIRRLVLLGQVDYYSLSTDELDEAPARGALDTDVLMATAAAGYMFGNQRHTVVVGLGVRDLSLDNELRLNGIGSFKKDHDLLDPLLIVAPSFRISDRWRFNPALAYSTGGDSEESYEFLPQFQFQMTEHIALRLGYRHLYFDVGGWDGSFQGALIGVGGTFGTQ